MSEEEIKELALSYVMRTDNKNDTIGDRRKRQEDFIAGAHSRNPEIEELKSELAKVKKEKELFRSAFKVLQYELDKTKWHDAKVELPPEELEGCSYSIPVQVKCEVKLQNCIDSYDYQAKRWMYNNGVLKWRTK